MKQSKSYLHIVYDMSCSSTGKSEIYHCNQNYGLLYNLFVAYDLFMV